MLSEYKEFNLPQTKKWSLNKLNQQIPERKRIWKLWKDQVFLQ